MLIKERLVYAFMKSILRFYRKNRKDTLLNGEELEKKFNFVKNQIKECNLSQRSCYKIPQLGTID